MSAKQNRAKRPFVSVSARQQRRDRSKVVDLPPMVGVSLRAYDAATRWPTALGVPRIRTDRDDLCAAYFRLAVGPELLVNHLIRTEDHLLIVLTEGNLVIESAGVPIAVREAGSAVVPPGRWRLTEVPATGEVGYWLLFFGPALLTEAIGNDERAFQLASQVVPAYRGVFVQPRLLDLLHMRGQSSPVADAVETIRALAVSMSASFYMYLREHYYAPRHALQDVIHRQWMDGARKLGQDWPGGQAAFRRRFRAYHGISVTKWVTRWLRTREPAAAPGGPSEAIVRFDIMRRSGASHEGSEPKSCF